MKRIVDKVLDFFLPRFCFHCRRKLQEEIGFLCEDCWQKIIFNTGVCCPYCGRALGSSMAPHACASCVELRPLFHQGISLFAFTQVGRSFIHTLKYHNGTYLAKDLLRLLEHEKERLIALKKSVFIPVPLYFLRQWKRGYNQSEVIAKALATYCEGSCKLLLKRRTNTLSQTSLTREERKKNVEGAFRLNVKKIDPESSYVLVDDVFTTGATLNACAQVLHAAGAKDIRVFTLAHG